MMMTQWTRILKEDNVKVWAISPGYLATGLGNIGVEKLKQVRIVTDSLNALRED